MKGRIFILILGAAVFQLSCTSSFQTQTIQFSNNRIYASGTVNEALKKKMLPYADSVNKSMNEIVGICDKTLDKKQPESTLGNFIADAMLFEAKEKYQITIDAAFVNYGGVRIAQMAAGPITKGKIFELMPFDNLIIVQKIKGDVLQQFLDLIASKGGWPLAGISMGIKNKKAVAVKINGELLDHNRYYSIANSDYVANGGDNAEMIRTIPQLSKGYLLRDAIFDYIKTFQQLGKPIVAVEEKRVVYVE